MSNYFWRNPEEIPPPPFCDILVQLEGEPVGSFFKVCLAETPFLELIIKKWMPYEEEFAVVIQEFHFV